MPEQVTSESKPSYGVTFERTISDGNYGSNKFSAWVSADVAADATDQDKASALEAAAFIAKATVYAQIGVDFTNEEGVLREAVARVERAFPGTTDVSKQITPTVAPTQLVGGVRVKGAQHGDLPTWLIEQAAAAGVTEVWDNRDKASSPDFGKKPLFKATTTAAGEKYPKGFWPK